MYFHSPTYRSFAKHLEQIMKFSVVGFTHRGQSRTGISKSAFTDVFRHVCNIQNIVRRISLTTASNISHPRGDPGLKSRMCPPYPHACRKRRLK